MKSFTILALVGAAVASAVPAYNSTPVYETKFYTDYTTVCPGPTTISIGPSSTITVSEATTLTITDCSCTITKPVSTPTYVPVVPSSSAAASGYAPVTPSSAPLAPVYPTGNATVPTYATASASAPAGTSKPSASATAFPGSAGKTGLSLIAVAGALAAFL